MKINFYNFKNDDFLLDIKHAANIYIKELGLNRVKRYYLDVYLTKIKNNYFGLASDESKFNVRKFQIFINDFYSAEEVMSTLAHELVHVRQFLDEKLRLFGDGSFQHEGKFYSKTFSSEPDLQDVFFEIEASSLEKELLKKWKVRRKRRKCE